VRRLIDFVTNMDARAWRSLAVSFVLFGGVGLIFVLGAPALGLGDATVVKRWLALAHGPWALPAAVAAFAVLAFLGAPQFALIAAAVVVFGPWTGSLYSWIGTLASALVGFWLGRLFGARLIRDLHSQGVERFMALVGKNGFMASLVVRLVPAAPFIVVNMAAGVTAMRWLDFLLGTGLGIIPKILITAFAGHSAARAFAGGGPGAVLLLAMAAAIWLGSAFIGRRWLRAQESEAAHETVAEQEPPENSGRP